MNKIMPGIIISALIFLGSMEGRMYYNNGPIIAFPQRNNIVLISMYHPVAVLGRIVHFPKVFPFNRWRRIQISPSFHENDVLRLNLKDAINGSEIKIQDSFYSEGRLIQFDLFLNVNGSINIGEEKTITIQITKVKEATADHYRDDGMLWVREVYGVNVLNVE